MENTDIENKVNTEVQEKLDALWKEKEELIKKNEELEKTLKEQHDIQIKKEFDEKAKGFANLGVGYEDLASILKDANEKLGKEQFEKFESILKSCDEKLGKSAMFTETGSNTQEDNSGAYEKIQKIAEEIKKSDQKLTKEMAFDLACQKNPKLYEEYIKEERI